MTIDQKVWNLFRFILIRLIVIISIFYVFLIVTGLKNYNEIIGVISILLLIYRILLTIYRRRILIAKNPIEYGRWALITGSTSGIGREFAIELSNQGMNCLLISRNINKLRDLKDLLIDKYSVDIEIMEYDFTSNNILKTEFYKKLNEKCDEINNKGGIGILINNVGIMNEIPKELDEFTDEEIDNMLMCNINSTVNMTRTVFKYMKMKKNGAVINISSGSSNHPAPMLAVYSATK